jgi:hypothetical protein
MLNSYSKEQGFDDETHECRGHPEGCRRPLDGLDKTSLTSPTSTVTPARIARAKPIGQGASPASSWSASPKISRCVLSENSSPNPKAAMSNPDRPRLYRASSGWWANITSSSSRITLGPASRNTSIISSEPGLVRAADAREAEMLASAFAESQRALMTAVRVVSKHIVRPARVAPSCTECTRPPIGRSRSGSRTTLASSWATAICPIRTE